jgi:hypothetical protein
VTIVTAPREKGDVQLESELSHMQAGAPYGVKKSEMRCCPVEKEAMGLPRNAVPLNGASPRGER